MKLESLYDGRHFPCYHYQPNLLAVGLSSRQEPENTDQITWLLLPFSEQQLQIFGQFAYLAGTLRLGHLHDRRQLFLFQIRQCSDGRRHIIQRE